ncbi:hypothetical protein MKEN_00692800 [Mycena kentingensis (nom. inval.)]|nr:hypothetical protein MKEN_00692800 [Mycena kentingensis (nom. inval.)]
MTLAQLPADILLELAATLESPADVLSLSISSKALFPSIAPALYRKVVLRSVQQCTATLSMLKRRTDIARHVRELAISPPQSRFKFSESKECSSAVATIAFSRCLDSLSKFCWLDDFLHEEMWLALRICCPRLRYLTTSVGAFFPSSSHLFSFDNLHGFSLLLGPGFYENNTESLLDEGWPPSKKLWDMLFMRCPNLEELSIEGFSAFPADARCVSEGRWPRLHKLSLGDLSVDASATLPSAKSPFVTFLEAHPELQSLSLSRHNLDPVQLQTLDQDALKLSSFSGTLSQLQALSHSYSTLKSLSFRDPLWSRDPTILTIANILQQLPALTDLSIVFTLHSPYDSSSILRALVSSCPHITSLTLACLRKSSFQLDALAKGLSAFRRLRTLNLTLVSSGDLTLRAAGVRFARANPRLREFAIAFVHQSYPHAIPRRPFYPLPRMKKATARFGVVSDGFGLPAAVRVRESWTTVWPWGLGARRVVKKYTMEVRQTGAGSSEALTKRNTGGWRGIARLLMESSPAGEELRMFVFCSFLCAFAVVFVVKG